MPPSLPTDSERVRQVMPGLEISSLRAGEDGLVNDVLIVNEELVFRFARGEAGGRALAREARLLAFIGPRVSLRIPEVLEQREGCLVCRFIPGVPARSSSSSTACRSRPPGRSPHGRPRRTCGRSTSSYTRPPRGSSSPR
jgi:hypothetical protein